MESTNKASAIESLKSPHKYTWSGVMDFLQEQAHSMADRETEWILEKQELQSKVASLEGELKAQENINRDLLKRVKMLEFALRQERIKYGKIASGIIPDENDARFVAPTVGSIPTMAADSMTEIKGAESEVKVAKRRAQRHREMLKKFLEELGLDDVFTKEGKEEEEEKALLTPLEQDQKGEGTLGEERNRIIESLSQEPPVYEVRADELPNQESLNSQLGRNELEEDQELIIKPKEDTAERISNVVPKKILDKKGTLLSHMDSIRGLTYLDKEGILASISEDCLVKLWSLKDTGKQPAEGLEPYFTLRGHTAPLFTICQSNPSAKERLIYTAGAEGYIRIWEIPEPAKIIPYGPSDGKNYCVGIWKAHEESIWQLLSHPTNDYVLSVSADSTIALWKVLSIAQNLDRMSKGVEIQEKPVKTYAFNGAKREGPIIPTTVTFVPTSLHTVVAGYKLPYIVQYDLQSGKTKTAIEVKTEGEPCQINRIAAHNMADIVFTGLENSQIKIHDLKSGTLIKSLIGHQSGVTVVEPDYSISGNHLFTAGNDGSIKVWDIRKYECLDQVVTHKAKYEEAVLGLCGLPSMNMIATGGADSAINLYEVNEAI